MIFNFLFPAVCVGYSLTFSVAYFALGHGFSWSFDALLLIISFMAFARLRALYSYEIGVFCAYAFVVMMPVISAYFDGYKSSIILISISNIFFIPLLFYCQYMHSSSFRLVACARSGNNIIYHWFFVVLLVSLVAYYIPRQTVFVFWAAYGVSILFFEEVLKRTQCSFRYTLFLTFFACLPVLIYGVFSWHGGGRVLLGGLALMPFLVANSYVSLKIFSWHIFLAAPFLIALAHLSRYGDYNFSTLYAGSVGTPMFVTSGLINREGVFDIPPAGVLGFLEQWSLLLLQWVPRGIWESKPLGVGLTAVDQIWGRVGQSSGHSTALGFIGETVFYLGSFFSVGLFFVWFSIVLFVFILSKFSRNYCSPAMVFFALMTNYAWGGMASFSSRYWFFVMPIFFLILLKSRIKGGIRHAQ